MRAVKQHPSTRRCQPVFLFFFPPCPKQTLDGILWNPPKYNVVYAYMSSMDGLSITNCFTLLFGPSFVTSKAGDGHGTLECSGVPRPLRAPSPRARARSPLMSSTPTTRSRTLLFLSYRDSRASSSTSHHRYTPDNDGDENERLIDPVKDHIAIDVGLPPKWSGHLQR